MERACTDGDRVERKNSTEAGLRLGGALEKCKPLRIHGREAQWPSEYELQVNFT